MPLSQPPNPNVIPNVLLQLTVIILAARCFAILFRRLWQPAVVGETAAGIILGRAMRHP